MVYLGSMKSQLAAKSVTDRTRCLITATSHCSYNITRCVEVRPRNVASSIDVAGASIRGLSRALAALAQSHWGLTDVVNTLSYSD